MSGNLATIASGMSQRFRSAFPRHPIAIQVDPDPAPYALTVPEIAIVAYAGDCVLSGRIRLTGERVSDVLNRNIAFSLTDALVEDLMDGHATPVDELHVRRAELLVVDANGPRGNAGRRRRTCQHPIVAKAGPYEVHGYVHSLPGCDPIASLRRRQPMVAITDAVIAYTFGSEPRRRWADVVMLNHERVDWIRPAPDDALMLDMPAGPIGPMTKDFTGYLYD